MTSSIPEQFKANEQIGMIRLNPKSISTLPSLGEKDVFRAFQLMPGVSELYEKGSNSSTDLTSNPSNINGGLGIFTGINPSNTLWIHVRYWPVHSILYPFRQQLFCCMCRVPSKLKSSKTDYEKTIYSTVTRFKCRRS